MQSVWSRRSVLRAASATAVVGAMLVGASLPAQAAVSVRNAVTCKAFKNGKAIGVSNRFKPSDRTIYCVVTTNKIANVKARFAWVAVNVAGIPKNTRLLDNSINVKKVNILYANAKSPRNWPKGKYQVKVYIDGKNVRNLNFSVA